MYGIDMDLARWHGSFPQDGREYDYDADPAEKHDLERDEPYAGMGSRRIQLTRLPPPRDIRWCSIHYMRGRLAYLRAKPEGVEIGLCKTDEWPDRETWDLSDGTWATDLASPMAEMRHRCRVDGTLTITQQQAWDQQLYIQNTQRRIKNGSYIESSHSSPLQYTITDQTHRYIESSNRSQTHCYIEPLHHHRNRLK